MAPGGRAGAHPADARARHPIARTTARAEAGRRLAPKGPRLPEPRIPEGVTGKELDRSIHGQLRTLSKENAEGVAQHLVMVAAFLEADDIDSALAHAETAVRRAGRVPAAREALGMVAYRQGDFARALTEFRTVRRLSGSSHLLPLMVDCERGLGRHGRALDLAATPEAAGLEESERIELAIVVSGIRRDLGQEDAALLALQIPALQAQPHGRGLPAALRLRRRAARPRVARTRRASGSPRRCRATPRARPTRSSASRSSTASWSTSVTTTSTTLAPAAEPAAEPRE